MEKKSQPLMVTIQCFTYNHEPYIRQCLEGFVMQKANFRFEAIVHDDASTDGTADIIREYAEKYPDIIKPIYETENQYSKHDGSLRRIMDAHTHGKYVALCEGDDYWTAPLKLQKQVDYLEKHPECGLVYAKAKMFNQKNNKFCHKLLGKSFDDFGELILENKIVTNTVLCREGILNSYRQESSTWKHKEWLMGDYPLWLYFAHKSKVHMLDDVVSVYRVLEESASHSKDLNKMIAFLDSVLDIRLFFAKLHNVDNQTRKDIYKYYKFERCTLLFKYRELKGFFNYLCSFSFNEKLVYFGEKFTRVLHLIFQSLV